MAFKVHTIPICKNETVGAKGTAGTFLSDIIELQDHMEHGACSLIIEKAATGGAGGTCGSSVFTYFVASTRDGTFATGGAFSTRGHNEGPRAVAFTPIVAPFMKIGAITGTSNPLVLTAALHFR